MPVEKVIEEAVAPPLGMYACVCATIVHFSDQRDGAVEACMLTLKFDVKRQPHQSLL